MISDLPHPSAGHVLPSPGSGSMESSVTPGDNRRHDAELVRQFNAGNTTAFAEIVSRHKGMLLKVALRQLRNPADAEEIVQDTFVHAHRASFDSAANRRWRRGCTGSRSIFPAITTGTFSAVADTSPVPCSRRPDRTHARRLPSSSATKAPLRSATSPGGNSRRRPTTASRSCRSRNDGFSSYVSARITPTRRSALILESRSAPCEAGFFGRESNCARCFSRFTGTASSRRDRADRPGSKPVTRRRSQSFAPHEPLRHPHFRSAHACCHGKDGVQSRTRTGDRRGARRAPRAPDRL